MSNGQIYSRIVISRFSTWWAHMECIMAISMKCNSCNCRDTRHPGTASMSRHSRSEHRCFDVFPTRPSQRSRLQVPLALAAYMTNKCGIAQWFLVTSLPPSVVPAQFPCYVILPHPFPSLYPPSLRTHQYPAGRIDQL